MSPRLASRPARLLALTTSTLLGAALGCGDATAVLVRFAPDPALSGSAELAPRLATLQLLLDADQGFAGLDDEAAPAGLRGLDADGDGQGELLLELNVSGRDALPVVRVDAGRNSGARIALQVRGLDGAGTVVALGGLPARALFVAGTLTEVVVPLNLVRALRPPHLLGAAPHTIPSDFVLDAVALHASRPLDAATLPGRVQVRLVRAAGGLEAVPGQLAAPRACAAGSEMWTFVPDACHASGPYQGVEIALGAGIADLQGQGLRDATGAEDVMLQLDVGLAGFGPCAPSVSCLVHGAAGVMQGSDAVCDLASGRFGPAACTLVRQACVDSRDAHAWITADSEAACQELRPDSTLAQDAQCVVRDPWPCDRGADCLSVGSSCNRGLHQCVPLACEGSCSDVELACAEAGCLPRMGTCGEDCSVTGACPELGQRCQRDDSGAPVCD